LLRNWLFVSMAASLLATTLYAQSRDLPDFGSPADSVLTKSRERLLGRSVILQLRNAGIVMDDPLLTEYLRLLGSRLASQVNSGDFDFEFFVIDDSSINAFAMPGGVIGVNAGLLLATDNESELAGVVAHEVSHVTQRHIARAMYDQQRASIVSIATMLAGILLATASDASGDAVTGIAAASQAAALQRQINFTRSNELEADRIGMDVLAKAGFDPTGMVSFFEKLSRRENSAAQAIPEMLRTHPVGSGRISESRSRARLLPRVTREDSIAYGLAKARLRVLSARIPGDAVAYYELHKDSKDPADRYGRALSIMSVGRADESERLFRELSEEHPSVMAFRIGRAEALMENGLEQQALDVYGEANGLSPRNTPLAISYGEALLRMGRADEAHALLLDLLNNTDATPPQIELLARAAGAEGDTVNAHHYMAEYYASLGDLRRAIDQLRLALALPAINQIQRIRFEARIAEFEEVVAESERRR
jgi:predicted Zn-dependent protease